uniref:PA14 domain-containing protein n=1 Tax=candidate division WWE3 bacterium TaxID=2053526 RepID=A0A831YYV2_UNCKA
MIEQKLSGKLFNLVKVLIFLSAGVLIYSIYFGGHVREVFSGSGVSSCGIYCGSSTCRPGNGCSGNNPYRFEGRYCFRSWECDSSSSHCHRCPFPSDCGNFCNWFSYCVQSCGGGGGNGNGNGGGGCDWSTKPNVAPSACVQANGLWGHYYRDNPVGEPRFDGGLKMERNDSQVSFDWGSGAPGSNLCDNNFSVIWTGYVNLSTAGNWRFGATSDDGFAIDLETTPGNWTRVFSDWSDHPPRTSWGGWYSLNAGWYGIRVGFYENSGGAVAQLRYERQGGASEIIPSANLRTCSSPCSTTAPSGLNATAITATSAQLNWTPGTGGTKQLVRLDDSQTDVQNDCPGGVGPGAGQCLLKDDDVPSGQSSYSTGSILSPGTRYYFRIVEYKDATCSQSAESNFVTQADPWVKISNGILHGNHLVSLKVAPSGQFNARWLISARGSVTGNSQEGWVGQYYPERNFNLTLNTPIKAPDYATLFKRFGGGAVPYAGPSLPNSSGVFLISGNKTVNGVFNQAGGINTLIFVDGNLTIDAEIRTAADSTLAFIVSGSINFSKDFAGGGPADDFAGGIYLAAGRINTAFDKTAPDEVTRQLAIEGALISLSDTISLDRNLDPADNQTTPAEVIDLSAKYYPLLKAVLGRPKFFYQEVPAGF